MKYARAILLPILVISGIFARQCAAGIYAQTGFNDQSGINSDPTPGSPYTIGQTINGVMNNEPGWTGPWTTLNGGGDGGSSNAVVSASSAFEGDGGLAVTVGSLDSTEFYRDFGTRTDHFQVSTEVNFGSVGEFDGLVIEDNYPLSANVNGPQWRLTGAVGSRHFEVFNGTSNGLGTWIDTGIAQTPGQWQDAVANINVVTQTWMFSVDGVSFNQTLGYQGAPPQLNAVYYFDTAAGSVDAIVVSSIPEPSSLACFAVIGSLTLLRRRRS
jgi:hypothetical protein